MLKCWPFKWFLTALEGLQIKRLEMAYDHSQVMLLERAVERHLQQRADFIPNLWGGDLLLSTLMCSYDTFRGMLFFPYTTPVCLQD